MTLCRATLPAAAFLLASLTVPHAARAIAPATPTPRDFSAEVLTLYRVAACGPDAAPTGYDAATIAKHCAALAKAKDTWRSKWLVKAAPFFAALFAGGYPKSVVYPFGGGDLLTLLAVYPDATEYTTLSLEGMGDARPVVVLADTTSADSPEAKKKAAAAAKQLGKRLATVRGVCSAQLKMAWNTTIQLSSDSNATGRDILPGVLVMTLVALEVHGYEPVSARYFRVAADGTLIYLTEVDVANSDADPNLYKAQRQKKAANENLVQAGPFNDIEITFRKRGDASAPLKTFRHLAADLSDGALAKDPGPLAHLGKKGKIAAMTKAASYLLWLKPFSKIRDFLLANMTQMVSDDTGIPPRYARPAGFTQETWGEFEGAYFGNGGQGDVQREMIALWKAGAKRKLPFRFGYPDNAKHSHLLYTYKK